jgi:hypothetical protein
MKPIFGCLREESSVGQQVQLKIKIVLARGQLISHAGKLNSIA